MEKSYNLRSPAVKRLMREAQELKDKTEQFSAQPLDDNLFEWHFTIRGPADSEFENGLYHGRIILPPEYPMKPPSIILLNTSGRFEINKKICLSISGFHPESWQPSWSLRTALLGIIGFMPSHGNGAIGSLDYSKEERKRLAKKSQDWSCPQCGLIKDLVLPVTELSKKLNEEAKEIGSQISLHVEKSKGKDGPESSQVSVEASSTYLTTSIQQPSQSSSLESSSNLSSLIVSNSVNSKPHFLNNDPNQINMFQVLYNNNGPMNQLSNQSTMSNQTPIFNLHTLSQSPLITYPPFYGMTSPMPNAPQFPWNYANPTILPFPWNHSYPWQDFNQHPMLTNLTHSHLNSSQSNVIQLPLIPPPTIPLILPTNLQIGLSSEGWPIASLNKFNQAHNQQLNEISLSNCLSNTISNSFHDSKNSSNSDSVNSLVNINSPVVPNFCIITSVSAMNSLNATSLVNNSLVSISNISVSLALSSTKVDTLIASITSSNFNKVKTQSMTTIAEGSSQFTTIASKKDLLSLASTLNTDSKTSEHILNSDAKINNIALNNTMTSVRNSIISDQPNYNTLVTDSNVKLSDSKETSGNISTYISNLPISSITSSSSISSTSSSTYLENDPIPLASQIRQRRVFDINSSPNRVPSSSGINHTNFRADIRVDESQQVRSRWSRALFRTLLIDFLSFLLILCIAALLLRRLYFLI